MTDQFGFSEIAAMHLRYHRWATGRMFELVHALTPEQLGRDLNISHKSLYNTVGHMYQADVVWRTRLQGALEPIQPSSVALPETLSALEQSWKPVLGYLVDWALAEQDWTKDIQYSNSSGKEFRTPAWQLALHLVNHASYHRGQVTGMIRQLGGTPQSTDLIAYYRLGCPD